LIAEQRALFVMFMQPFNAVRISNWSVTCRPIRDITEYVSKLVRNLEKPAEAFLVFNVAVERD
jgi:hypothetical protein